MYTLIVWSQSQQNQGTGPKYIMISKQKETSDIVIVLPKNIIRVETHTYKKGGNEKFTKTTKTVIGKA